MPRRSLHRRAPWLGLCAALAVQGCADDGDGLMPPDGGVADGGGEDAAVIDAGPPPGTLDSSGVGEAQACAEYRGRLEWVGEAPPGIGWSVTEGGLPPGLALDAASGVLHGRPTVAGAFTFTVTATATAAVEAERSARVDLMVQPGLPSTRWALVAEEGAAPGPQDDAVRLLDVCGATPGEARTVLEGQASLPFTGRPVSEQNAYAVGGRRIAIHHGTYDPLDLRTVVYDLPTGGADAPVERLRVGGLFATFGPLGGRLMIAKVGTEPQGVEVHEIPESGPARQIATLSCPDGCPVAWSSDEAMVATLTSGDLRVRWLASGAERVVATDPSMLDLAFAADGASVLVWGAPDEPGPRAYAVEVSSDEQLGPAVAVPAEAIWVNRDPARARHPIRRLVWAEQGGLRDRDLEDPTRPERPLAATRRAEGWRASLAPTGQRLLVLDTEGPRAQIHELDVDPPRVVEIDLLTHPDGERPVRLVDLGSSLVQWRPDGDRVVFTGRYEGCGCVLGQAPCPKVAITLLRRDADWVPELEYDVDAAGLEQVCQERGLFSLVAQGALSLAPSGRFLAVSRTDLTFFGPSAAGLAPWTQVLPNATTFFRPDRWTPDGHTFVTPVLFQYLGGLRPAAAVATPGVGVTAVALPPGLR